MTFEPTSDSAHIAQLGASHEEYAAPRSVAEAAFRPVTEADYQRSIAAPEAFWAVEAGRFIWTRPWDRVLTWDGVHHAWFAGARTNITLNALDRYADSPSHTNRVAYIWRSEDGSERMVTYGQLRRMVCRLANGLKSIGVGKGDRVVIYLPLTIEGIASMLACARIGAIHSVVYAGLGHGALRDRIADAQAKVVIAGDVGFRRGRAVPLKSVVDDAVVDLECVEKIVVFSRRDPPAEVTSRRQMDFNDLLKFPAHCPAEEMDAEDPLFILYTSGTTGKPKGVVHVHGGFMVGTTYHLETFYDVSEGDVFWCTSDIGWIVGHAFIVYSPLCAGATTLIFEGAIDYPHPGAAWEIVEKYGVTKMFTAPTALRMFMKYGAEIPAKYDLTSLRLIACAGEPLNPEAWRWAQTHLAGDGAWGYVVDNWWQTELGAPTIGTTATMGMRPGKAGRALAGVEADVIDAQGNSVPPGVGGRLVVRKPFPHMMRTVWNDAPRYEKMWQPVGPAPDGSPQTGYISGDIAVKDEDGYIAVLGRADDVLNVAGHRIGTADVESALVSHPAVAEAAVIGVPDALKGEAIKAFVVCRQGHAHSDFLLASLIEHVRRELGPIATPAAIEFLDALPKTRSGKIMRRYLKAKEMGMDPGDISTLDE
ncbi:MAG: acetate--CoA ligase [Blastocatellia bacterium]|nr:acetate--CoA ligase [Blastocatellia bacterium]